MRRLSLRLRLTAAFAAATAVLLAVVGTFVFLEVKHGLDASLDASLDARARALAQMARGNGPQRLRRALALEGEPTQLIGADGGVLAASPSGEGAPLVSGARLVRARTGRIGFERNEAARLVARPAGGGTVLVVSTSMAQREHALETLGGVLLVGGPLILLLSSGAGYLVAAGALRPVERMRRRAAEISDATPAARLPLPAARDELQRLGETLNAMLARLGAAAAHERAFLRTASHELRTPLAILRAEVELALEADPQDAALRSVAEEIDRLARLADDLLVLARQQDGGQLPVRPEPLVLRYVVERVAARFALLELGAVVDEVAPDVIVRADRVRLEQALGNLVANALRHGAAPVSVRAEADGATVTVHVADAGPGFAEDALATAFGPLGSGSGLGLPIVGAIARAHGGCAGVARRPGGADVWIRLPAAADPRPPSYSAADSTEARS